MPEPAPDLTIRRHLILYDGVCGLCDRANRFVIQHDKRDVFRFASLQSDYARNILRGFGRDPDLITTVYAVQDFEGPERSLLARSDAAFFVLQELGGIWRGTKVLRVLPKRVLDGLYEHVARTRYRWFGRFDACPMPTPETRRKFIATE